MSPADARLIVGDSPEFLRFFKLMQILESADESFLGHILRVGTVFNIAQDSFIYEGLILVY